MSLTTGCQPTFLKSSLVRLRPMASMSRPTPHSNCCVVIQLRLEEREGGGRRRGTDQPVGVSVVQCGLTYLQVQPADNEYLAGWKKAVQPEMSACGCTRGG